MAFDIKNLSEVDLKGTTTEEIILASNELKEGKKSYYDLLGLKMTASNEDINKAYRKLSLKFHPDKIKKDEEKELGAEIFKCIANAKDTLLDNNERNKYDGILNRHKPQDGPPLDKSSDADRSRENEEKRKAQDEAFKKAEKYAEHDRLHHTLLVKLALAGILTDRDDFSTKTFSNEKLILLSEQLDRLKDNNCLTRENWEAIKYHENPANETDNLLEKEARIHDVIQKLINAGCNSSKNQDAVKRHSDPMAVADGLISLNQANILTDENRDIIGAVENPLIMAKALVELSNANISVNSENRNDIIFSNNLPSVIEKLKTENILNQSNFDMVIGKDNPLEMTNTLIALNQTKNLNIENLNLLNKIYSSMTLSEISEAIDMLNNKNILARDTVSVILNSGHPLESANTLIILNSKKILTSENCETLKKITSYDRTYTVNNAVEILHSKSCLDQNSFDAIKNNSRPETVARDIINIHDEQLKKMASSAGNKFSFFASPTLSPAVEYLKKEYIKNGGGVIATRKIFGSNPPPTYEKAVEKLQKRAAENTNKPGASNKTLAEVGVLQSSPAEKQDRSQKLGR